MQDLKQAVVGELINENNSGTFVRAAGTDAQGVEDRDNQRGSGFGDALWSSVKGSVLHGPLQSRNAGDATSEIGYSAEVRYHKNRTPSPLFVTFYYSPYRFLLPIAFFPSSYNPKPSDYNFIFLQAEKFTLCATLFLDDIISFLFLLNSNELFSLIM